jgi:predicted N-acetyltransferase YhbS
VTDIRRARVADDDAIVELLSDAYGRPGEYFAPRVKAQRGWRSGVSWVLLDDGRIVAHVRVLERLVRSRGAQLRVAGIADVATAAAARGRGHAGRLLRAALQAARAAGMPYALLWSRRGGLYLRHGFVEVPYARMRVMPSVSVSAGAVRPFAPADAPDVRRLQRAVGPVRRSAADWDFELRHRSAGVRFLVMRRSAGDLAGYVRARPCLGVVELRDLAIADRRIEVARALLVAVADGWPVNGPLPRWLSTALGATELPAGEDLMGKTLDREALAGAVGAAAGELDERALAGWLWRGLTAWPADMF